jgi:hypothetical protein
MTIVDDFMNYLNASSGCRALIAAISGLSLVAP